MPPSPAEMLRTEKIDFFTRCLMAALSGALAHAEPCPPRDIVARGVAIADLAVAHCHVWKSEVGMRADVVKRALLAAITGTASWHCSSVDNVVQQAVLVADLTQRAHRIYLGKVPH